MKDTNIDIKILLIENHFLNQVALKRLIIAELPNYNVTVDIADNGKIGVEKFQSGSYDIIILDTQISAINSFEDIAQIRTIDPHIAIIAIHEHTYEPPFFEKGFNAYLSKPYKPKELKNKILELLTQKAWHEKLQITNRKLNPLKKRFELVRQMVNAGFWEIDAVTNEMDWSDGLYKMLGFEPGRIKPSLTHYLNYVYTEDREMVQNAFSKAMKDGNIYQIEYRFRIGTAPIKYVNNQFKAQFDDTDGKLLLVGALYNITKRKHIEKLFAQPRFGGVKGNFLRYIDSRIHEPLASAINISHILGNSPLEKTQKEVVEALQLSVSELSSAINNLLNFSVLISDKITVEEKRFTVHDTIRGLVIIFQIKANKKSITLDVVIDEDLPKYLIGDEKKLTQILYNLLDNAVKYSMYGDRIELQIKARKIENGKATISFSVADNSAGMSKKKIEEILNTDRPIKFNKKDKNKELGLAVSIFLTQKMGGELNVLSEEGAGTTLTFEIEFGNPGMAVSEIGGDPIPPLETEDHFLNKIASKRMLNMWSDFSPPKPTKKRKISPPKRPIKILLVEDHSPFQTALKFRLLKWSNLVSVDIAKNGKIDVEKFEANDYNIILINLWASVMGNFKVITHIRIVDADIPIIGLLSDPSEAEIEKYFAAGMNDYIVKPYKFEDIKAKIMNIL